MIKTFLAGMLASSLGLASAPAYAQAPSAAASAAASTTVAPVTVKGRRRPPAELESQSAACIEAARDPMVRAMMAAGARPRIYVPTRPPRNPDYSAPPKSAPGSALPQVPSLKERLRAGRRSLSASGEALPGPAGGDTDQTFGGDTSVEAAVSQCLTGDVAGGADRYAGAGLGADREVPFGSFPGPAFGAGRAHIKQNDKTLPLGFALFDQGRYAEALQQFTLAYKKLPDSDGGIEASLMMGKIYLYGLRDRNDPVKAVYWLDRAAFARFVSWNNMPVFDPRKPDLTTAAGEASVILADLYRTGHGPIPKDIDQSVKYLKRAVYVGHVASAKTLGDLYYEGVDTPRDLKAAFKYYSEGAKFAHAPSMIAVARMYEAGEVDGRPNLAKALAWRTEAAKQNDPESLYLLAVAYDRGEGVEADPEHALALYKVAAVNGQPAAQAAIGNYFYTGEAGMPHDPVLARKWFEHAAMAGDPDGMFNLAAMMAKGEGGPVDKVKAWGWFRIADRAGHPNAAAAAQSILAQMTPQERAGVEALVSGKAG